MALTVEELAARRSWIGSSDVPALLGVDRYKNIADLYLTKIGAVELRESPNEAANLGDHLEEGLCNWLAHKLDCGVTRGEHRNSTDGLLRAQLDGFLPATGETCEIKTTGLFDPTFRPDREGWGADGTDDVPYRVIAQVQFALMLSGAPRGHVVALLGGGGGVRHYVIESMPDLQAEIERRARAFWHDHVIARIPPEPTPNLDTLRYVVREPEKVAYLEFDSDLADDWMAAKTAEADAKASVVEVQARVLHAMGDAEELQSPFGTWSYYANKRGVRSLRFSEKVTTTNE